MQEADINNSIRCIIKKLRLQKSGKNVKAFADFLQIPYTSYKAFEDGVHKKVRLDILVAVHQKMGVDINVLLTGEEPAPAGKEPAAEEGMLPGLSPLERVYVDRLLEILRTKDQGTVSAITQNIDTFLRVPAEKHPPFIQGEGEEQEKKKA